jgi:predicted small integral membrane protein
MCAVILVHCRNTWTWPQFAFESFTAILILFFMLAVWYAKGNMRNPMLALPSTNSNDSALIAALELLALAWTLHAEDAG